MCDECHQHPHATMCPNNPTLADDDPIMKRCPICEREFDEEEMDNDVCDECLQKNNTYENALKWGASDKTAVTINGYLAWQFSVEAIEEILKHELDEALALGVLSDYSNYNMGAKSDFADWLVEQKKGGG